MEAVDYDAGKYFRNEKTKEIWAIEAIGGNKYFVNRKTKEVLGYIDDRFIKEVKHIKKVD